jgi:hypothetical protein
MLEERLLHPWVHSTSRQEVVYIIQLYITASLRHTFLSEQLRLAEQARGRNGRSVNHNTNNDNTSEMDKINKAVERRIQSKRFFIKRQSHFFDQILYKRADTLEEYYNIDNMGERLNEVGKVLNAHLMRRQNRSRLLD